MHSTTALLQVFHQQALQPLRLLQNQPPLLLQLLVLPLRRRLSARRAGVLESEGLDRGDGGERLSEGASQLVVLLPFAIQLGGQILFLIFKNEQLSVLELKFFPEVVEALLALHESVVEVVLTRTLEGEVVLPGVELVAEGRALALEPGDVLSSPLELLGKSLVLSFQELQSGDLGLILEPALTDFACLLPLGVQSALQFLAAALLGLELLLDLEESALPLCLELPLVLAGSVEGGGQLTALGLKLLDSCFQIIIFTLDSAPLLLLFQQDPLLLLSLFQQALTALLQARALLQQAHLLLVGLQQGLLQGLDRRLAASQQHLLRVRVPAFGRTLMRFHLNVLNKDKNGTRAGDPFPAAGLWTGAQSALQLCLRGGWPDHRQCHSFELSKSTTICLYSRTGPLFPSSGSAHNSGLIILGDSSADFQHGRESELAVVPAGTAERIHSHLHCDCTGGTAFDHSTGTDCLDVAWQQEVQLELKVKFLSLFLCICR